MDKKDHARKEELLKADRVAGDKFMSRMKNVGVRMWRGLNDKERALIRARAKGDAEQESTIASWDAALAEGQKS